MNIEEFREYCLAVKGAEECMPFDNQTLVYKVMGKMFTYVSLQPKDGRFCANSQQMFYQHLDMQLREANNAFD